MPQWKSRTDRRQPSHPSTWRRLLSLAVTLVALSVSVYGIIGRSPVEATTAAKGCCYCRQCHTSAPACANAKDMDTCAATCRAGGCDSLVFGFVDTCQTGCGGMPAAS